MFALNFNPLAWLIAAALLSGFGAAGVQTLRLWSAQNELGKMEGKVSSLKLETLQAKLKGIADVRQKEAHLNAEAEQTRKEIHDQVAAISVQRDALAIRVRDILKSRASAELRLPSSSQAASLGGPAFRSEEPLVLGSLGEEDVDEATRADIIRTHYLACEAQYELARTTLNGPDDQ